MIGSPCSNSARISVLLCLYPCGPTFQEDRVHMGEGLRSCTAEVEEPFLLDYPWEASLLARSLRFEFYLVIAKDPSAPSNLSACAASTESPRLSIFCIHWGMFPRRVLKKSLMATQALLGNVVEGSSHLVSMLSIAGYDSSSCTHSLISSFHSENFLLLSVLFCDIPVCILVSW